VQLSYCIIPTKGDEDLKDVRKKLTISITPFYKWHKKILAFAHGWVKEIHTHLFILFVSSKQ
jgi:hypothetical protein